MESSSSSFEFNPTSGMPKYFSQDHYLNMIEQYIMCDEIERALWLIDNPPAYFRDHPIPEAQKIRDQIYKQLMSLEEYCNDKEEKASEAKSFTDDMINELINSQHCYPRGPIMCELVKKFNDEGKIPHIIEMSPANYWLPRGLKAKDLKFTYKPLTINKDALTEAKTLLHDVMIEPDPKQPKVFVCFETIEHLWNEDDIYHFYVKQGVDADIVAFSTPCYTLFGGLPNWHSRELGHVRAYTPSEFIRWANKNWPNRQWQLQKHHMMVLLGSKLDDSIKPV